MKHVATYEYRDESGEVLFQKLRYEPKTFRCRRPVPTDVRKGMNIPPDVEAWTWGLNDGPYGRTHREGDWDLHPLRDEHQLSLTLPNCRRVLYRLPELLAANPDAPVFLVEGEKDVESLREAGFTATCTWTGSASVNPEWLTPLSGRRVVVIPDNDDVGIMHAIRQAGWLLTLGARSVRFIQPGTAGYDVAAGGDSTDWLMSQSPEVGKWRQLVIELCKRFGEYKAW